MPDYREGKKYTFERIEFYACCGAVRVHLLETGQVRDIPAATFLDRAANICAELDRVSPDARVDYQRKKQLVRMAQAVEDCCKEAAAQGDPFDPRVVAFWARHKTYRRPYVAVPGTAGRMVSTGSGLIVPRGAV